jgi:hypothetical protein
MPAIQGTAGLDFYNPVMGVSITTTDNKTYPLWTYPTGSGQSGNFQADTLDQLSIGPGSSYVGQGPIGSLSYVSEVSVETDLGHIPKITVTLTPPFREAIRILDSDLIVFGGSKLEVTLGYLNSDGNTIGPIKFSGVVIRPDVRLGVDTVITLNAQGFGSYAMTQQGAAQDFNDVTRVHILDEVFSRHPVKFEAYERTRSAPQELKKGLLIETVNETQGHRTDWQFCSDLLYKIGCYLSHEGDTVYVQPRDAVMLNTARLLLSFFDISGGRLDRDHFPILNMHTDASQIFLPGVRPMLLRDISAKSRNAIQQIIDTSVQSVARNKGSNGPGGSVGPSKNPQYPDPKDSAAVKSGWNAAFGPIEDPEFLGLVRSTFSGGQQLVGTPLEIETLGNPYISPRDVVTIDGAGLLLQGDYAVFKVRHIFNNSGYTTHLTLRGNTSEFIQQGFNAKDTKSPANQSIAADRNAVTDSSDSSVKQPTDMQTPR